MAKRSSSPPTSATLGNRAEGDVDQQVLNRFFARDGYRGFMVDVGAARPDYLSIGAGFRSRGWRVLGVEPNPEFCEMHRQAGNEIYCYACGEHDRNDVPFSVVDSHRADYKGGEVTFESFSSLGLKHSFVRDTESLDVREIRVQVRRLDTILSMHAPDVREIDVLSADVEGWELEVLAGLSFNRYRPKVLIIENMFDDPQYMHWMAARGYRRWARNLINDVFVRVGFEGVGLNRLWMPFIERSGRLTARLASKIRRTFVRR